MKNNFLFFFSFFFLLNADVAVKNVFHGLGFEAIKNIFGFSHSQAAEAKKRQQPVTPTTGAADILRNGLGVAVVGHDADVMLRVGVDEERRTRRCQ